MRPVLLALLVCSALAFAPGAPHRARRAWNRKAAAGEPSRPNNVAVVLLAGGKGTRMKSSMPKQFLPLLGRPLFSHSLDIFQDLPGVTSIVVVLDAMYREEYGEFFNDPRITFADPGKERQDSVSNGLAQVPQDASLVCIHDSARPLVTRECVEQVLADASTHGAAVLAVPMKATVKESADGEFVLRTLQRSRLWEIQTPQVATPALLQRGFERVAAEGLEVTDDVSVVEVLGEPVKLTVGEYTNLKVTTPDDLPLAEQILREARDGAKAR